MQASLVDNVSSRISAGCADEMYGAFRRIPLMGVIQIVAEATLLGFWNGDPDWCNLGQGQPEVGEIDGAPARIDTINLEADDHAYGPISGTDALRQRIADHYNRLYRSAKRSQYTAENVTVAGGGRAALSRIFASIDAVDVGYQVPDYAAFEDLIGYHEHRLTPTLIPTPGENGFVLASSDLIHELRSRGLGAFVFSNPCNPTGRVIKGDELASYVRATREERVTIVFDEFYSHFVYEPDGRPADGPVSAAAFVDDVNQDPVVIVDGLTKNFRYPGWRLGWTLGPKTMVDALGRAGSALDGGPSRIVQRAAMQALEPIQADQETRAVRRVFARKRNLMVEHLRRMGITCGHDPEGTFYVWGSVAELPPPLNDGQTFFRRALQRKVITAPGVLFDINPAGRRRRQSPFMSWVRFSFGPTMANIEEGLGRLRAMIEDS